MSEQENTKVATSYFDYLSAHNLDAVIDLLANDFQGGPSGGTDPINKDEDRVILQNFLTAFPDLHFEVALTVAQGDHVVINWVANGAHNGPLDTSSAGTIEPTGKKITVLGSATFQIKDGKISRSAMYWDMAGLLDQLGVLPSM